MAFSLKKFTTALKAKFSTNKTPSSSHRFGLFLSDGTPDGNATPVDVAQLLGGIAIELGGTSIDLNNLMGYGIYRVPSGANWSSLANRPLETGMSAGIIQVLPGNNMSYRVQKIVTLTGQVFYRYIHTDPANNEPWYRITTQEVS